MNKKEINIDKNNKLFWRRLNKNVCCLIIYLKSNKEKINISNSKLISDYFNEYTRLEKVEYSLLRVKKDQNVFLKEGTLIRCFRCFI